jgi:tRNA(Ile)-lysidine synthase
MLAGGEFVLVAASGGVDSTALLHLLVALAGEWRLRLHAAHVDHGLRPDSAADAAAVRELGERLGVPVSVVAVKVERGGSLEAAARAARYRALEAEATRLGADRIAVGHTADDQAETVLMRLLEGASVRGLAGIPAVRGRIIRPLLGVRRRELVDELRRAGLPWREDPSNADPKFLRNRIRHDVLPVLAAAYDADVVAALGRVAREARAAITAIDQVAADALGRWAAVSADEVTLPVPPLATLPAPIAVEVLRQAVAHLGRRAPSRAWTHRRLERLLALPSPRRAFAMGGVVLEASTGVIRVARTRAAALAARTLAVPGRVDIPEIGRAIEARVLEGAGYVVSPEPTIAAFDADEVGPPLIVRGRRAGDRFTPFGGPGERRLKSFLIDAKLPRWERARLPIVEARGRIVWLAGVRRAALAPVEPRTRRVLELRLVPLAEAIAGQ